MNDYRYASAERYYEALDILESGACIQLQKGQVTLFLVKISHIVELGFVEVANTKPSIFTSSWNGPGSFHNFSPYLSYNILWCCLPRVHACSMGVIFISFHHILFLSLQEENLLDYAC